MEISKDQYEKIHEFSDDPAKHGFDMKYDAFANSCVDFSWAALNHDNAVTRNVSALVKQQGLPIEIRNTL